MPTLSLVNGILPGSRRILRPSGGLKLVPKLGNYHNLPVPIIRTHTCCAVLKMSWSFDQEELLHVESCLKSNGIKLINKALQKNKLKMNNNSREKRFPWKGLIWSLPIVLSSLSVVAFLLTYRTRGRSARTRERTRSQTLLSSKTSPVRSSDRSVHKNSTKEPVSVLHSNEDKVCSVP